MTLGVCVQKTLLFGVGGVLLAVGVIMASLWPLLFNSVMKSQLALTEGSNTYAMWVKTPLPMYMDIYLFNWTNSHDVSAKPVLQQVGPYVFSEEHFKVHSKWNENSSITYQQYRQWIYQPELSNGSLSDNITNLNVMAVTIGALCKDFPLWQKEFLNAALSLEQEKLIVTRNVSQLLFEGYSDPLLDVMKIVRKHNVTVPVNFDKFGWFYGRNLSETADGVFTMNTGENDIDKLGDAVAWNNRTVEPFYSGSCGKVEGSFGELWSPNSARHDSVNLYAFDMCGSLPLKSSGILSLHSLSGTKFSGDDKVFDNGTLYSANKCYCRSEKDCPASGIRDISSCRGGAPVYVSFPHFYLADPSYRSAVEGLSPDPQKHSFSISLEEKTGIPLQVSARLQINLLVEEIPHMSLFTVPHTYMPMIWFHQHAEMTPSMAHAVRPLSLLASYGVWVLIGVALLGLILVLSGLFLKLNKCWESSPILSQSESSLLVPEE